MKRKKMPKSSSIGSHDTSTCGQMLESSFDFTLYVIPALVDLFGDRAGELGVDDLAWTRVALHRDDVASVVVAARLDRDLSISLAFSLFARSVAERGDVDSFSLVEESVNIE